jgi:hypothetical protein
VIDDGTPYAQIQITHKGIRWSPVAEPTVWGHESCLDDLELTISAKTTVEEGVTDQ